MTMFQRFVSSTLRRRHAAGQCTARSLRSRAGRFPQSIVRSLAASLLLAAASPAIAQLAFAPPNLYLGGTEVGETSQPRSATLQNSGAEEVTGLAFEAPDGFEADTSACADSLPAGGSCEISVTFSPLEPRWAEGTLTVTSDQGSVADLGLTGCGLGEGGGTEQHETVLVSRACGFGGEKGNSRSGQFNISPASADGRYVAFHSIASNLHPDVPDAIQHIFVRDLETGETILASRASGPNGGISNGFSNNPAISADGRFVVFRSDATNLHPDDTDNSADVFMRDLQTNETVLVSRASGQDGDKGDGGSVSTPMSISSDGRYITFQSLATNLHPDDVDSAQDVFVRDVMTYETVLVSRASGKDGEKGNGSTFGTIDAVISANGRHVAFRSDATNLHPDDTDNSADVFMRDLQTNETVLVSRASGQDGDKGDGQSGAASVSVDGRFVAFESSATNLHPDDPDGLPDVFMRDLETGETVLVSRASGNAGEKSNSESGTPTVSGDGRFVAYNSAATNLHPDDTDATRDVYIRDLFTQETLLVSRASGVDGEKGNGRSRNPAISADGRFVTWWSQAANLHPDDADTVSDVFLRDIRGSQGQALLAFVPPSLSFGEVEVGTTSLPLTATLHNTNDTDVTGLVFNAPGEGFDVDGNSCGTTLPPGESCDVAITFTPLGIGPTGDEFQVDSAEGASATLTLEGNGVESEVPELTFVPVSIDFGDIEVGTGSPPQSVTLGNTGDVAVTGLFFLPPGSGFVADTTTCGDALAPEESCEIVIHFSPPAVGPVSSVLEVGSAQGASASLVLGGNGVEPPAPELAFSPSSLDFGDVQLGSTSAPQSAALSNAGDDDATGLVFSTPAGGFTADTSSCGDTLLAGESCAVSVTFTPSGAGPSGVTLMVDSAEGATATLGAQPPPDNYLYFGSRQLQSAFRMDPGDIHSGRPIFTPLPGNRTRSRLGVVVDMQRCAYYWTSTAEDPQGSPTESRILTANIDGTGQRVLYAATAGTPASSLNLHTLPGVLYFTRGTSVYRGTVGATTLTDVQHLVASPGGSGDTIRSLVVDFDGGRMYWAAETSGVWSAALDGADVQLVNDTSSEPQAQGLALDHQAQKIYWGDGAFTPEGDLRIHRANLDGTEHEVVLLSPTSGVSGDILGVAVDPNIGKLFWSDNRDGFFRANLDGSGIEPIPQIDSTATIGDFMLVPGDIDAQCGPPAANICPPGADCNRVEAVYWAGGTSGGGELWRSRADGSYREMLHEWIGGQPPGLAVSRELGKVYWTRTANHVYRANLDGSDVELLLQLPFASIGDYPGGIALDVAGGKMYIGQRRRDGFEGGHLTKTTLWKANLDGSDLEVRFVLTHHEGTISNFGTLAGPRIDPSSRIGYVVGPSLDPDHNLETHYRFDLDSFAEPEVILPFLPVDLYPEDGPWEPYRATAFVLDRTHSKIYWQQTFQRDNSSPSRTYRMDLDGTNIEMLPWTANVGRTPHALDPYSGRMYGKRILSFEHMSRWEIEDGKDMSFVHASSDGTPLGGMAILPTADGGSASLFLTGVGVGPVLEVSPELVDFGPVPLGGIAAPQTVTVTNAGNQALEVTSLSMASPPFARTGGNCPAAPFELAPETSCTLDYSFAPSAEGEFQQALTMGSNAGPAVFTLTGEGIPAPPTIALDPESFSFTVAEGQSAAAELTIANTGGGTLNWEIDTAEPTGSVLSTWSEAAETPVTATFMSGFGEMAFAETGDVLPLGDLQMSQTSDTNIVPSNSVLCPTAPNHLLRRFYFDEHPGVSNPAEISSVDVAIQDPPASQTLTVNLYTLPSGTPVDTIPLGSLTPIGSGAVTISPADGGSIVNVPVSTTVGDTGAFDLVVEATANVFAIGATNTGQTHPGFIMAPACGVTTPTPIGTLGPDFEDTHIILVVNAGAAEPVACDNPSTISWLSVTPDAGSTGEGETDFVSVAVDAADLAPGEHEAVLCVTSNDLDTPLVQVPVSLTVAPLAAELTFDPAALDFGEVEVGSTGGPLTATLTNSGALEATGLTFDLAGGAFAADTSACGTTLPAGGSCAIDVTFTPTEAGPATASFEVTSDGEATASLPLSGSGTGDPAFTPVALAVDPVERVSDGNSVFEPDELVDVMPSWRNDGNLGTSLTGTASQFAGPDGADYELGDEAADYGLVEAGATASCEEIGLCYRLGVNGPAARPATHWMATFDETLSDDTAKTWALHIGDSFADVPRESLFYVPIETLLHSGITGGCTDSEYCPAGVNTRAQMAIFLLKAVEGADYVPEACVEGDEAFLDVSADNLFCPWIEALAESEITSGCGGDNFCPSDSVTRAQMAVFLLKAALGSGYTPPACTGEFDDVPCSSLFAAWVEDLAERGITAGCGGDNYCPNDAVTRGQMAVFLVNAFGLELYGP